MKDYDFKEYNLPLGLFLVIGHKRWFIRLNKGYGWGLAFKNVKEWGLTFSEKNGYKRHIVIFGWLLGVIKPFKKVN